MCIGGGEVIHLDDWGVGDTSVSSSQSIFSWIGDLFTGAGGGGDGDLTGALLQGAGAGMQAYGAYEASKATKGKYKYDAQVAINNARIAEYQAEDALRRGEQTKVAIGLKTGALKGSQRASLAARGIDIGEGSPLDILTSTDYMGGVDTATATTNAEKEAWGHRVRAKNYESEAEMLYGAADNTNPFAAAAGTLLTGAGRVADSWYRQSRVS